MTEITQQDVLLSILALDAYNRGSALELSNPDKTELSTVIGPATVSQNSDQVLGSGAVNIGFSATSYALADGKTTVIAYRGTDFTLGSSADWINFFRDVITGWGPSFGTLSTSENQPQYAQKFYEKISKQSLFPAPGTTQAPPPTNIILTGHSLGGSLAGYVGSISGSQTVIFNEIPYLGMSLFAGVQAYLSGSAGLVLLTLEAGRLGRALARPNIPAPDIVRSRPAPVDLRVVTRYGLRDLRASLEGNS
jgi:Protein of unknown function (DUF2974)